VSREERESVDRGRRAFLRGRFLQQEGWGGARKEQDPLGPVPPALISTNTTDNPCIGCDAPCIPVCETDVIRRHPKGHPLAERAYLSFEANGCTFCGDCIDVCPVELPPQTEPIKIGMAVLNRSTCVAWEGVVCLGCKLACRDSAVIMDESRRPHIDADRCTGCGLCVGICPPDAITVVPLQNG